MKPFTTVIQPPYVIPTPPNVIPAGEPGSPYVVLGLPYINTRRSRIKCGMTLRVFLPTNKFKHKILAS